MNPMIEVKHLKVMYKDFVAVKDISFAVKEGELFALLGKNGAGKSTTIHVLVTLLRKAAGTVLLNGHDLDQKHHLIKKDIGVVFQNSVLDKLLTVSENIETRASLYGMTKKEYQERLAYLTEKLELQDILHKRYGTLSGGQKRKVDIARALIHKPKILFLDEPTTGLDPITRIKVWEVVNELREKENTTIVLTTHYMEEAGKVDHVVIVDQGEVLEDGTPTYLKDHYAHDNLRLFYKEDTLETLKLSLQDLPYEETKECITLKINKKQKPLEILNKVSDYIVSFELIKGDMDSVFMNVTGGKILSEV